MIQRIQSLYFLVTFIFVVVLLCLPLAYFIGGAEEFVISAFGIKSVAQPDIFIVPATQMGILAILCAVIPFISIFLYRKRWIQIRLCFVEIVLLFGLQVFIAYYIFRSAGAISEMDIHSIRYSIVDIIPLIGIILSYLAFRGVARDETLIKSLNRIR